MKEINSEDQILIQNIELGFIKFDSFTWKQVRDKIKKRYNSGFEVCLEHPEYIKSILMEIFGESYHESVKKLTKGFEKNQDVRMESFIKTLQE